MTMTTDDATRFDRLVRMKRELHAEFDAFKETAPNLRDYAGDCDIYRIYHEAWSARCATYAAQLEALLALRNEARKTSQKES